MFPERVLLDTNVIVRLVTADHPEHFKEAKALFVQIENGQIEAELLDLILAEVVYVLTKAYGHNRIDVAQVLKNLLAYEYLAVSNRAVLVAALDRFAVQAIDFADAILCAKKQIEGYGIASFDKKVLKC